MLGSYEKVINGSGSAPSKAAQRYPRTIVVMTRRHKIRFLPSASMWHAPPPDSMCAQFGPITQTFLAHDRDECPPAHLSIRRVIRSSRKA